jgi:hypothetical protein
MAPTTAAVIALFLLALAASLCHASCPSVPSGAVSVAAVFGSSALERALAARVVRSALAAWNATATVILADDMVHFDDMSVAHVAAGTVSASLAAFLGHVAQIEGPIIASKNNGSITHFHRIALASMVSGRDSAILFYFASRSS